jgi:hypothetical protein
MPKAIPLITPPAPIVGPVGEKVYVTEPSKLEIIAVPAAVHVAAVVDTVGTTGVVS